MNCAECKELLVGYMEGLLKESEKQAIELHLKGCPLCRAELDELIALHDRLVTNSKALSQSNLEDVVLDRIVREQSLKLRKVNKFERQFQLWRIIMKSRITKLAAAAAIIIVALIGIHQFIGPEVAWAEVLKNIRNAKTVRWKTTIAAEGHEPQIMRAMVIESDYIRFEVSDGIVMIMDRHKGKGLILNYPAKGEAILGPTDNDRIPDFYNAFRNFRDLPGFSVKEIGTRRIEGKRAIGFQVKRENEEQERTIWVDPETELPIRIEEMEEDREGNVIHLVTTDIMFDVDLDIRLFSLEPPEGYELKKVDPKPINRLKSAVNVDRILKACRKYVAEHNGQWPDSLKELTKYGIEEETFINPRQPEREVGYIYLKPPASPSEDRIVLYEAYDEWNEGINVGYASSRVQFVRDESGFEKQLKESSQSK